MRLWHGRGAKVCAKCLRMPLKITKKKKKPKILLDLVNLFSFFTFSQQHALFLSFSLFWFIWRGRCKWIYIPFNVPVFQLQSSSLMLKTILNTQKKDTRVIVHENRDTGDIKNSNHLLPSPQCPLFLRQLISLCMLFFYGNQSRPQT